MKQLLKQLLPPILTNALKKPAGLRIYDSYADALADCTAKAYENNAIIQTVIEKNKRYAQSLIHTPYFDLGVLRTLIGLGCLPTKHPLKVLDFGGGGGYHYTIAKTALGPHRLHQWAVVETPAMTAAGQSLTNESLQFFDTITAAQKALGVIDVVFSSCALNYCPAPLAILEQLIALKAPYLYLTRMPLSLEKEKVIRQTSLLSANGPGALPEGISDTTISYPNVLAHKAQFEALLKEQYNIRFMIEEDKNVVMAGKEHIHMYGYFCEQKG